ncbi:hypothetical protein GCM10025864_21750 [Luteimicrobium album]|uniref:Uncharacterized protein n=1 Tax=Luteimicrobium album TaxID=1054550 RepID=A0ABQ6I0X1_9MICO|nr:hypothetical protein GCM10025864_21750 [Luteimicrobium album]
MAGYAAYCLGPASASARPGRGESVPVAVELDDTFAGWVGEAYAVGRGDHLIGPR